MGPFNYIFYVESTHLKMFFFCVQVYVRDDSLLKGAAYDECAAPRKYLRNASMWIKNILCECVHCGT